MSFHADKKREHEQAAEGALATQDYAKAFFHTAKAAEFGLKLAERSEGKVAHRYVDDANELIAIAGTIKGKIKEAEAKAKTKTKTGKKDAGKRKSVEGGAADKNEDEASNWELQERPDLRLDDVAGLEEVKQVLREKVIYPFQHPEVYQRFKAEAGAGIIMYGPPGNGKTFVARAIAGELDAAFFPVDASQIKDKYVGETEKNLTRLFDDARGHEKSVIFFDEVDHLLSRRGNRKIGAVTQFLALTDGLVQHDSCLLLLTATNKPWALDEAVVRPGRLGTHIYVGPPDATARSAILAYHMRGVPVAEGVGLEAVAADLEKYSGADVAAVCDRAKMSAIARQLASGQQESITTEDLDLAISKVQPSVTPAHLHEFEKWRDARENPAGAPDDED